MSSPEIQKKKKEPSPLKLLPEDLLLSCVARVSRLYYPTLSFVSKRFRSLLVSPELYKVRSLLGRTENCLYVCIESDSDPNPSWYPLCRKPDQSLTNDDTSKSKREKSSGYVLAKVPIFDFPRHNDNGLVAVGSSIYNISGSKSTSVSIMDCTSHTWRHEVGLSIPLELRSLSASVLDGKIYVAGCYKDKDGSIKNMSMVLDTKTQIWDAIPIPRVIANDHFGGSTVIDGKFHVETNNGEMIAYDSKEGGWDFVREWMWDYVISGNYCVIENVLYSIFSGALRWYDRTGLSRWRNFKGLVGLPKFPPECIVSLADYGGKMVVFWHDNSSCDLSKKIWCAEIKLETRCGEIWGKVEWCDHVLTIPNLSWLGKCLAPTV